MHVATHNAFSLPSAAPLSVALDDPLWEIFRVSLKNFLTTDGTINGVWTGEGNGSRERWRKIIKDWIEDYQRYPIGVYSKRTMFARLFGGLFEWKWILGCNCIRSIRAIAVNTIIIYTFVEYVLRKDHFRIISQLQRINWNKFGQITFRRN